MHVHTQYNKMLYVTNSCNCFRTKSSGASEGLLNATFTNLRVSERSEKSTVLEEEKPSKNVYILRARYTSLYCTKSNSNTKTE